MTHDAELSCDFLAFLGKRLGKSQEATMQLLGDWLSNYEPVCVQASSLPPVTTLEDERLSA